MASPCPRLATRGTRGTRGWTRARRRGCWNRETSTPGPLRSAQVAAGCRCPPKNIMSNIKFSNTFKNVFKIFAASHLLRCDVTDAVRCVLDTRGGFHRGEVILLFRVHEHLLYLPLHRAPRLLERLSPLDVCRLAALLQPPHGDSCGLLLRRGGS